MESGTLIMAGGRGERFWPSSRQAHPKQMMTFGMENPLVVQTARRITSLMDASRVLIITGESLVDGMKSLFPELPENQIIGEPVGRNTAPCIGVAAVWMAHHWGKDCVMVILSADHYIARQDEFAEVLRTGIQSASEGNLVTIGLKPDRPETGYGYLELEKSIDAAGGVYPVRRFLEKPDAATAEHFFTSGRHLWNGGMFLWKCSRILEEIQKHLPELAEPLRDYQRAVGTAEETATLKRIYPSFPNISIDYAIMEKAERVVTIPADIGWDDLGNWTVLERLHQSDEDNNVVLGSYAGIETKDCIISCDSGLVAALGVDNLVIVKQGDVVLVMPKDKAADLKQLVEKIKQNNQWSSYL